MIEIRVTDNLAGQRLSKVLNKLLKDAPDSFLYKMLRKKNITLNGKKADGTEKTESGDTVQFFLSPETYEKMGGAADHRNLSVKVPEGFPKILVLYEDSDVCIFIKPAGVLSQKAEEGDFSANEWAIAEALKQGYLKESELAVFHPAVVNRLDRNTQGIMAAGFSINGLQVLSELFRERENLAKDYYALVKGTVSSPRDESAFLSKDEASNKVKITTFPAPDSKPVRTSFEPVKAAKNGKFTLVSVHLHTGRSHQIRAHLSSLGFPVLGDMKYGDRALNREMNLPYQCLCSYRLSFPELPKLPGISGKTFEIPVPEEWPKC